MFRQEDREESNERGDGALSADQGGNRAGARGSALGRSCPRSTHGGPLECFAGCMLWGKRRDEPMLGAGVVDLYFAGNLTGFTIGLVISVLLLVLVARRAAALPQSPRSLIVLAVCSLLWNAGGLANVVQHPREIVLRICPANVALALQFTGAGIWPVAMLAIWRRRAVEPRQCVGWRYLQAVAAAGAAVIVGGMWAAIWLPAIPGSLLRELAAYNATFPL